MWKNSSKKTLASDTTSESGVNKKSSLAKKNSEQTIINSRNTSSITPSAAHGKRKATVSNLNDIYGGVTPSPSKKTNLNTEDVFSKHAQKNNSTIFATPMQVLETEKEKNNLSQFSQRDISLSQTIEGVDNSDVDVNKLLSPVDSERFNMVTNKRLVRHSGNSSTKVNSSITPTPPNRTPNGTEDNVSDSQNETTSKLRNKSFSPRNIKKAGGSVDQASKYVFRRQSATTAASSVSTPNRPVAAVLPQRFVVIQLTRCSREVI